MLEEMMVFGVVGCNNLRVDRLANRLPVSNVVASLDDEMLSSLVDVVVVVVIVGVE